jgi:hypothetical protein
MSADALLGNSKSTTTETDDFASSSIMMMIMKSIVRLNRRPRPRRPHEPTSLLTEVDVTMRTC